jgi:succinate dehydrogenase / fumarate reductase cytochrome b subunit
MASALTFYRTTIGKKVVMAVTGFILAGYVVIHMLANLKIYQGPEAINAYGTFLRTVGEPIFTNEQLLWIARIVLLAAVILHIVAAYQLTRRSTASRPVPYTHTPPVQTNYAARTMRWGGVIILLFVIYHILHFTTGTVHPEFEHADIYGNVVAGFQVWYVSAFYIAAMLALGLHLYHGVWSMFQTIGWNNARYTHPLRIFSAVLAVAVVIGFISIPIAVMAGFVR